MSSAFRVIRGANCYVRTSPISIRICAPNLVAVRFSCRKGGHTHTQTHARTHARTHANTKTHTHTQTHTRTHPRTHVHTYPRTHTDTHVHTHTHMHTHTHTHVRTHARTHTHACTHAHTHTRTHTHTHQGHCCFMLQIIMALLVCTSSIAYWTVGGATKNVTQRKIAPKLLVYFFDVLSVISQRSFRNNNIAVGQTHITLPLINDSVLVVDRTTCRVQNELNASLHSQ